MFEVTFFQHEIGCFVTLSNKRMLYTNELSGVSLAAEGFDFGFLFGTNRGLRPDPGPDVMLLWITLRLLLRKSREPAYEQKPLQSANLRRSI